MEHHRIDRHRIELEAAALKRELVDKMSALATAAFALVAALAWNTAIQAVFKRYYPAPDDPSALLPLVGYAIVVSLIGVLCIIWIGRVSARLKRERDRAAAADAATGAAAQQGDAGKGARA